MHRNYKKLFRKAFVAVYRPYIVRKEKFKATRMWRKGVKDCIKAFEKTNGPRFYLWFDENSFQFFPMVLDERPKGDAISMRYLQRTQKIKARRRMTPELMKQECFYYTPSKHGAIGCESDNRLRIEKYNKWINFYMNRLSEPMRKLRLFQP